MKPWISLFCILCLLIAALPLAATAAPAERTLTFAQLSGYYRPLGRALEYQSSLYMDNTASGFEFYFNGGGDVTLTATVMCNAGSETAQYFTVIVDGQSKRLRVACDAKNTHYAKAITLASGLANGDHHIEVYRQTEAAISSCCANSLTFTGTLLAAPPQAPLTIDVIGDSISGGYGCLWNSSLGVAEPTDNNPAYEDGTQTYAFLAGKKLGADVRVTQTSGYGCVAGWNGRDVNLQTMYPLLCWWRSDTFAYPFDTLADVVIINLGTNDYNTRTSNNLTNAEFQAGAKNLMQMARQYNPGAKVVWCTGMMGTYYATEVKTAITELGGADNGYFFVELPRGQGGGVSHPTAAQQATAADVLYDYLKTMVIPCAVTAAQTDAATLRSAVQEASAIANPSAPLQGAIDRATTELNVGTTDPYRLYQRLSALKAAAEPTVRGLSLMPKEFISDAPTAADGVSYVWPYYATGDGSVGLYKGGDALYWPQLNTPIAEAVDIDETPYLYLDFFSTASFNVALTYRRSDGELAYVNASSLANLSGTDFEPQDRRSYTLDFGAYVKAQGHVGEGGLVPIVSCQLYVIGTLDQVVRLYDCGFTSQSGAPNAITGSYTVTNGLIDDVAVGITADAFLHAMDNHSYLTLTGADGSAVSGKVATGMILKLTVDGSVRDQATLIVRGDVNSDGDVTTTDARFAILHRLGASSLSDAQALAADYNKDGAVSTLDAREILLFNLTN